MSCYHPYAAVKEDDGNIRFLSGWNSFEELKQLEPKAMLLPCNHCIGCKMDYSRKWADRMMLELESNSGKGLFLTLTYECRNVVDIVGDKIFECEYPEIENTKQCPLKESCYSRCKRDGSLYKPHMSEFMKNLRSKLDYHTNNKVKVKFYGVGEYGDAARHSHRPHYHIILFGVGLDDFPNKIPVGQNELRQFVYTDPFISDCWPYGNISFGDVSWRSCAYVSRYVNKKVLDPNSELYLDMCGKNHMFSLMSRRPGIGKKFLDEHPDCLDCSSIYLSTSDGARKINMPRYYINQLKNVKNKSLYDEKKYDTIMAQRALYAEDSLMSKLSQTDLPLYEYLEVEEKNMIEKVKTLKRDEQSLY